MGKPELYTLNLEFELDGKISDHAETQFGIREVTSELISANRRVFSINGKNILIRGGGWSPDMMLRENPQRLRDEFRYVQDMGLNTIRLEGKLETEEFFDLADRARHPGHGRLVLLRSLGALGEMEAAGLRHRRTVLARPDLPPAQPSQPGRMWLNGSDNPPPPDVEQTYLKVEKELLWPNPVVSSATAKPRTVTGRQRREDDRAL